MALAQAVHFLNRAMEAVPLYHVRIVSNSDKHSQETRDRIKANSEASKKRLAGLNAEYEVREKARVISRSKTKPKRESFGQAVTRITKETQ
jgi:hypothetical protein